MMGSRWGTGVLGWGMGPCGPRLPGAELGSADLCKAWGGVNKGLHISFHQRLWMLGDAGSGGLAWGAAQGVGRKRLGPCGG